jgi:hypothetical protein
LRTFAANVIRRSGPREFAFSEHTRGTNLKSFRPVTKSLDTAATSHQLEIISPRHPFLAATGRQMAR